MRCSRDSPAPSRHFATGSKPRKTVTALLWPRSPKKIRIWSRVVSGSDTRIGARCDYYEDCFVTRVRRRAESAQLVVVNHHLFFADLALRDTGFASVLPDYDAVIFDEAHQIEDTATLFFGSRLSTTMLERLVRDARTALGNERGDKRQEARLLDGVLQRSSNFFAALPAGVNGGRVPLPSESIPQEELFALDNALAESRLSVATFVRRVRMSCRLPVGPNSSAMRWAPSKLRGT